MEAIFKIEVENCPAFIVIGGTSAELNLKTVKLASTKYLDDLPAGGGEDGQAFRDLGLEEEIFKLTQDLGVGTP